MFLRFFEISIKKQEAALFAIYWKLFKIMLAFEVSLYLNIYFRRLVGWLVSLYGAITFHW